MDAACFRGRISPFISSSLEGVEAEAYIWPIDKLNNVIDVAPGRGLGGPAPILIGETKAMG